MAEIEGPIKIETLPGFKYKIQIYSFFRQIELIILVQIEI